MFAAFDAFKTGKLESRDKMAIKDELKHILLLEGLLEDLWSEIFILWDL